MKVLELRFAADTVALLNENRIQPRLDDVALISGYVRGERGLFGRLVCAEWTNFLWECDSPGMNIGDTIREPFSGQYSDVIRNYIETVERVLNSEVSILHYADMDTPYTMEFEFIALNPASTLGIVSYDVTAKRYAFTPVSEMPEYRY